MLLGLIAAAFLHQKGTPSTLEELRSQARLMVPLVSSESAKHWLEGVWKLPNPTPRPMFRRNSPLPTGNHQWITKAEFEALDPSNKSDVLVHLADSELYYNTKYGTPIAYARVVDLAAKFGLKSLKKGKVMDFGYGGIGQLRLFALGGVEAVGVDVDPFLPALYCLPEDQGAFGAGKVRMIDGHFPSDASIVSKVGTGYDLIVSKNTLKRGYIHPSRPADKRQLIDLGVSDEAFLAAIQKALKPGGLLVIYNLCPAPAAPAKPYVPWAEGQSPFSQAQYEQAGLKVLALDVQDDEPTRKMAHALGWDKGDQPMDLTHDLFSWYTVVQRR